MRKSFLTLALAVAAMVSGAMFTSCEKMASNGASTQEYVPEGYSTVTVNFAEPALTKAGVEATSAEKTINSVYLFVFDKNNKLEAKVSPTIAGDKLSATASVTITNGQKTLRVIANAGSSFYSSATVGTTQLSAFDSATSNLSDNSVSGLVMIGQATQNVLQDVAVNISMERLASKVCLTKITRNFTDSNLAALDIKVTDVWVSNVAGNITWGKAAVAAASQSIWYNKNNETAVHTDLPALLYNDVTDFSLAQGTSREMDIPFYIYSNPATAHTEGGTWSPRVSRLIVQVTTAGSNTHYYICPLPQTEPNKVYNVDLTIKRIGANHPDHETETGDINLTVSASISVANWGSTTSVPVTIE